MDKTERRLCWYSAILIGLVINSPKLLALREGGIVARYWHFNLAELLFQVVLNIGFCFLIFYIALKKDNGLPVSKGAFKQILSYLLYIVLLFVCCLAAGISQRRIFDDFQLRGVFWSAYLTRYFLSIVFSLILVKIVMLIRESKVKDKENSELRTAYLEAELEVLKEQLNPHFLFNSLSSLSGVVREDPEKAQHFIGHLSKIFRYSLAKSQNNLVTIEDELVMIKSYEELLKMRFENAFKLETTVDKRYLDVMIPHLTLQPLLENAAKHNMASLKKPLTVKIFISDNNLVVSNNLQEIAEPEGSTGIGLVNLNSRFRILMHKEICIEKTKDTFTVKLPVVA
jgi:two-component system LytT family sensor kinase